MATISVFNFKGSTPRLNSPVISEGVADYALDCKLTDGSLDSWYEPKRIRTLEDGTKTIINKDCCWKEFDTCVDYANGPPTCRQTFITGWKPFPVAGSFDKNCEFSWRRLGVPCPIAPPETMEGAAPPASSREKDIESRSYAFQYVNEDGVRGDLSPGTVAKNIQDGQTIVVSGWDVPDPEWGVTDVRIYRTVAGDTSGREPSHTMDTTWMFVGEVDVNSTSFSDSQFNDDLFVALEEDQAFPPPKSLKGIVWVKSMNCLAGFTGNRIYFSENNFYDYWPHWYDLDDNIRGIAESNGTIYVATDGHPYTVDGRADGGSAENRAIVRMPHAMPMLGFGSRHIRPVHSGAVFASTKGLVQMAGGRQPSYLTWPLYSEDDWQQLRPEHAIPVEHDGKLYVFSTGGSFVMQTPSGPEPGWGNDSHSSLSDTEVIDAFITRQGELMLVKEDGVFEWNKGTEKRPHVWRSGTFTFPVPRGMGAGHVVFSYGEESINITANQTEVVDRDILSSRVFRLPMWSYGSAWQFEVYGTGHVSLVEIKEAMQSR